MARLAPLTPLQDWIWGFLKLADTGRCVLIKCESNILTPEIHLNVHRFVSDFGRE
jgi:hypothetical protein